MRACKPLPYGQLTTALVPTVPSPCFLRQSSTVAKVREAFCVSFVLICFVIGELLSEVGGRVGHGLVRQDLGVRNQNDIGSFPDPYTLRAKRKYTEKGVACETSMQLPHNKSTHTITHMRTPTQGGAIQGKGVESAIKCRCTRDLE